MRKLFLFSGLFLFFLAIHKPDLKAQAPVKPDAADILLRLKKLNVVGSALYVAAHPDDENTALIAWLANEKMVQTGYLSLTRGDGGQNLIGPEIRERLGLIRTHELLQARRLDGGQQFFTRANDFGFSKDYQETLKIWDKEKVLADMVWTIRKFKPDVMVTRFSPEPGGTHGHHTTSAILASEAFEAAADPKRYPEQLKFVAVWQPKRLLWNTSSFFYGGENQFDPTGKLAIEISTFNPILGKSYPEIAAASRSMHKSQGFGSGSNYGKVTEYLVHTKGTETKTDLFEGINLTWNRVKGGEKVAKLLQQTIAQYNPANPSASVPLLLQVKSAINNLPENPYKAQKQADLQELIKSCLGLFLEATAAQSSATPGEQISVNAIAVSRSTVPVELQKITFPVTGQVINQNKSLQQNLVSAKVALTLPAQMPTSQPYWLKQEGTLGMYAVNDQQLIGLPENPSALAAEYTVLINQEPFTFTVPVVYKRVDPVEGEIYKPFSVTPPVFVNLTDKVLVFADDKPKQMTVTVKAGKENTSGRVTLEVPMGWRVEPASAAFTLPVKEEEKSFVFQVYPTSTQSEGTLRAVVQANGQSYNQSLVNIDYRHIPALQLFPEATAKVTRLDLKKSGSQIGYLMGPGDEVPASLSQIGYQVTLLSDHNLTTSELKRFDAVVIGVRAYNTDNYLKFAQAALLDYVAQGGTLVVQYNVNSGLVTDKLGPYPFQLSRDRVAVEDAPVKFLKPNHPVLSYPNKITAADFNNWVQERGLYFANKWDNQYEAILSSNDPGEPAREGGLLVAKHGKGYYIYTGYAFFRQLPAGVPGAYRLFTNLISTGKNK
ncbi:PIG-L family deacetylase [Adhaeribacter rhizoryzae]|uniref:PIG-L family deacetylase n=1 Tax=Adhaeribacter rhizoryzae TaxID=2607907 RepID=A0A5M6DL60_9BACT|nr:PIG-L family deacetylase [Adhaeribacter rhizoryzae]KAA5548268.1 PIG-L family deacetylase [Adhaeribacter rhizoryzae]